MKPRSKSTHSKTLIQTVDTWLSDQVTFEKFGPFCASGRKLERFIQISWLPSNKNEPGTLKLAVPTKDENIQGSIRQVHWDGYSQSKNYQNRRGHLGVIYSKGEPLMFWVVLVLLSRKIYKPKGTLIRSRIFARSRWEIFGLLARRMFELRIIDGFFGGTTN